MKPVQIITNILLKYNIDQIFTLLALCINRANMQIITQIMLTSEFCVKYFTFLTERKREKETSGNIHHLAVPIRIK